MHVVANDTMAFRTGCRDKAGQLGCLDRLGQKRKWRGIRVAFLLFEPVPGDAAAVKPGRRPCLEASWPQAKVLKLLL